MAAQLIAIQAEIEADRPDSLTAARQALDTIWPHIDGTTGALRKSGNRSPARSHLWAAAAELKLDLGGPVGHEQDSNTNRIARQLILTYAACGDWEHASRSMLLLSNFHRLRKSGAESMWRARARHGFRTEDRRRTLTVADYRWRHRLIAFEAAAQAAGFPKTGVGKLVVTKLLDELDHLTDRLGEPFDSMEFYRVRTICAVDLGQLNHIIRWGEQLE